jgi:hypothetical protein
LGKLKRAPRDETGVGSGKEDDSEEEDVKDEDVVILQPTQEVEAYTILPDDRLEDKLWKLWRKRQLDLQLPLAIAGYYLCPVPEGIKLEKQMELGVRELRLKSFM